MAFWKRIQMKINKKWYPKSVLVGSPVSTEQLCKRIGAESTVSPADVRAVLTSLAPIMADYMSQGRSVKLDGIGSFYFTAVTTKNAGVRVRFNPETRFTKNGSGTGKHATRGLSDTLIEWEEWKVEEKKTKKKGVGEVEIHGS